MSQLHDLGWRLQAVEDQIEDLIVPFAEQAARLEIFAPYSLTAELLAHVLRVRGDFERVDIGANACRGFRPRRSHNSFSPIPLVTAKPPIVSCNPVSFGAIKSASDRHGSLPSLLAC